MQGNLIPPSKRHVSPVAYGFLIIPSTAIANSVEFPNLPKGVLLSIVYKNFYFIPLPIGVWNIPGAIVITRILYFPRSLAIGKVIPMRAPFEAEQATWPFCPQNPATLATLIITPLYPSISCCPDITLAAYFETFNVPITFIFKTFSVTSEEITPLGYMVIPAEIIPAQFTTTWICLQFYTVKLISFYTFFSSATFVLKNRHPSFFAVQVP